MTVREFVNAVSQNPHLLDLELCVVTNTGKVDGGQFDGSMEIRSKPVHSVILGNGHLLIFADSHPDSEKADAYVADLTKWPGMAVIGPIPDCLKW